MPLITPHLITQMARRLARRFKPDRIILFGSRARGEARPDSDVDLLVITNFNGSKREAQLAMRLALHDFAIPFDVIIATPEEIERRHNIPGTLLQPALREGKVLYARP